MPTSAIVGQARDQISSLTGWLRDVRAAEVELRRLLDVGAELLELRAVQPELVTKLFALLDRQVAAAEQIRDRVLLDDAEEEEVEDDDESKRRERAEHLADDEAGAHARAVQAGSDFSLTPPFTPSSSHPVSCSTRATRARPRYGDG